MAEVTFKIRREFTEREDDIEGQRHFQAERKRRIHALIEALDLDAKLSKEVDDTEPHEWVEIIVALASSGVFTALIYTFKSWVIDRKATHVKIITPDKLEFDLQGFSMSEITAFAKALNLS